MRIATFNINGLNKRLPNLLAWLEDTRPDVVCLQETKTADEAFPQEALEQIGYGAVFTGQRTWNGVAILARDAQPVVTRRRLPGDAKDDQPRYIEAAVNGVLVACLYLPNGNPQPGPKFDYKLAWTERLLDHAAGLLKTGAPVILAGDFNVVPTDADIYNTRSWKKDALLQPQPRAQYAALVEQGWTDALRALHPDDASWTFWSYFRDAWTRDAGMRIDHLLLSPALAPRLKAVGVDREVRGQENARDHAPAWVKLAD